MEKKMKRQKKTESIFIIAVIIVAAVILAYSLAALSRTSVSKAVAEVNGHDITEQDLQEVMITVPEQLRANLTRDTLIQQAINLEIIMQEAGKAGIAVSSQEVEDSITGTLKSVGMTMQDFSKAAKQQGISEETMKNAYKKQLTALRFVNQTILSRITVSEDEIKSTYSIYSSQLNLTYDAAKPEVEYALRIQKGQLALQDLLQQKRQEYSITVLS